MSIYQRNLTTIGAFLALLSEQGPVSAFVLAPRQTAASGVAPSCTSTFDVQPKGNSWGVKSSLASATNAAGEAITSTDEAKRNLRDVLAKNSRRTQNGDVKSAFEVLRGFNPIAEPAKAWHLLNGEWVAVGYDFPEMTFTPEGLQCTLGRLAFDIFEPVSLPVRIVKINNSARPRDPSAASSDVAESWNPYDLTMHFCSRDGSELRGKVVLKGSCTTDPEDPKRLLVRFSSSVIEPEDGQDLKAWRSVIGLSGSGANSSESMEKTRFRAFAALRKRVANLTPKLLLRFKPRVKEPESRGELTHEMARSPNGWTDVLYIDEEMRITRGNRGSVVVAIRE